MQPSAAPTRPASYPDSTFARQPDLFGFAGTDLAHLERQYHFYVRAYGLPVATPCADEDGEPSFRFHYPEEGEIQLAPNLPRRVTDALAYLIAAISAEYERIFTTARTAV